jgi:hypothetical protein
VKGVEVGGAEVVDAGVAADGVVERLDPLEDRGVPAGRLGPGSVDQDDRGAWARPPPVGPSPSRGPLAENLETPAPNGRDSRGRRAPTVSVMFSPEPGHGQAPASRAGRLSSCVGDRGASRAVPAPPRHPDAAALRERVRTCDAAAWAPLVIGDGLAGRAGASRRRCAHTIAQGTGQPWNPQRTALPAATRRSCRRRHRADRPHSRPSSGNARSGLWARQSRADRGACARCLGRRLELERSRQAAAGRRLHHRCRAQPVAIAVPRRGARGRLPRRSPARPCSSAAPTAARSSPTRRPAIPTYGPWSRSTRSRQTETRP